jgi:flavin reductase (DIM6/NTAB) family NADH-FMN oxidoreductase RutF
MGIERENGSTPSTDRTSALSQIPGGLFVLTASFDGRRTGCFVKWVQPCSTNPPMVMVALATGQSVEPLIRDSRSFTLCQISSDDRFLMRKFNGCSFDAGEDPLMPLMTSNAPSGAPIVERALSYLDCEVVRHVELDADHRIYVGQVHVGGMLNQGQPAVRWGTNGNSH